MTSTNRQQKREEARQFLAAVEHALDAGLNAEDVQQIFYGGLSQWFHDHDHPMDRWFYSEEPGFFLVENLKASDGDTAVPSNGEDDGLTQCRCGCGEDCAHCGDMRAWGIGPFVDCPGCAESDEPHRHNQGGIAVMFVCACADPATCVCDVADRVEQEQA